jgi:hypothetical protein
VHHLSCHFDGVLIDVDRARNLEPGTTFEQQCEKHIKQVTGYDVKVVKKVHDFFLPLLKAAATSSVASDMPTALREEGNCIPLALARLTDTAAAIDKQLKVRDATNTTAAVRRVRCYRDWSCFERWVLVPSHGLDIKSGGKYLVHSETKGKPHCTALITDASGSCQVFDNDSCFTVDHGVVRACQALDRSHIDNDNDSCFLQALDRSHIVTFKLAPSGEEETAPQDIAEDCLLELLAGGDDDPPENDAAGDEAEVHVGDEVRRLLQSEVDKVIAGITSAKGGKRKGTGVKKVSRKACACPCCPWRRFARRQHLREHVMNYHKSDKDFVASGRKQLRIIVAM